MKQSLLIILLIAFLNTKAQVTISERITNNKNKSLLGLSIALKSIYDEVTADSLGKYSYTSQKKEIKNWKLQYQAIILHVK